VSNDLNSPRPISPAIIPDDGAQLSANDSENKGPLSVRYANAALTLCLKKYK